MLDKTILVGCIHDTSTTHSLETILWFILLQKVHRIIDEGKSGGLAPTIRCPETEADHNIGSRLVHLGKRFSELTLGNVGTPRVEYVHYL